MVLSFPSGRSVLSLELIRTHLSPQKTQEWVHLQDSSDLFFSFRFQLFRKDLVYYFSICRSGSGASVCIFEYVTWLVLCSVSPCGLMSGYIVSQERVSAIFRARYICTQYADCGCSFAGNVCRRWKSLSFCECLSQIRHSLLIKK